MGTCRLPGQAGHRLKNFQLTNKVVWRTRTCDPSRPCVRKPHLPFVPAGIPRLPNPYPNALGRLLPGGTLRVFTRFSLMCRFHMSCSVWREHALWHVVNVCTSYLTAVSFLVSILRITVQGFDGSSFNYAFMQYSVNKYSKLLIVDSIIAFFDSNVHGFEL